MDESDADRTSPFRSVKDFLIAVLIVFGGIYLLMAIGSASRPVQAPAGTSDTSSVSVGSEGRLINGSSLIPVAIDEELLPNFVRAARNHEPIETASLNGPIFFVREETSVRVSESGVNGLRVRILAGPQKGRIGWVPFEWVKPPNILN
jgi:hypothetical protein